MMKIERRSLLGAGAAIAGAAAVFPSTTSAKTTRHGGGKAERRALGDLEDYAAQHCAGWSIPGMIVAVVGPDGFEGQVMTGKADVESDIAVGPDHLFQVGSITKMMAGLTLWSMIDEGKLSPDDKLVALMPELQINGGEAITLQHLLNHTSGLPGSASPFIAGGLWTGFEPGAHWEYCNLGYKLIGMIAARTDKSTFPECAERRVLRPLAMTNSLSAMRASDRGRYAVGYQPAMLDRPWARPGPVARAPWVDYDRASGCIASTGGDMAKLLRFLLALARGDGAPIFSNGAAKAFIDSAAPAPAWAEDARYGNGIAQIKIGERDYLNHTGGMVSFTSSLHVDPTAGVAAFASANLHYASAHRPRNVTHFACELLRAAGEGAATPDAPPTKATVEDPGRFAGAFTSQDGAAFEITANGDALKMRRKGRTSDLTPTGATRFASGDIDFTHADIDVELEEDRAVRVWVGGDEYLTDPSRGHAVISDEQKALAGVYESSDRWDTPTRIFPRADGKLFAGGGNYARVLTPTPDGGWRTDSDNPSANRLKFDSFIDGKPQRLVGNGEAQIRRDA